MLLLPTGPFAASEHWRLGGKEIQRNIYLCICIYVFINMFLQSNVILYTNTHIQRLGLGLEHHCGSLAIYSPFLMHRNLGPINCSLDRTKASALIGLTSRQMPTDRGTARATQTLLVQTLSARKTYAREIEERIVAFSAIHPATNDANGIDDEE